MSEPSYPTNGTKWRLDSLERRMTAAELEARQVAVLNAKIDNLVAWANEANRVSKEEREELRGEVRYLRRVLLGLLVSITLAAIVFGASQLGGS